MGRDVMLARNEDRASRPSCRSASTGACLRGFGALWLLGPIAHGGVPSVSRLCRKQTPQHRAPVEMLMTAGQYGQCPCLVPPVEHCLSGGSCSKRQSSLSGFAWVIQLRGLMVSCHMQRFLLIPVPPEVTGLGFQSSSKTAGGAVLLLNLTADLILTKS